MKRIIYFKIIALTMLFPKSALSVQTIMGGICSQGCTIFVDTQNGRVDIATGTYSGGVPSVGLYISSNVVIGLNGCTIYSTGTLNCPTVSQAGASIQWTTSGNKIYNNNSGNVGIGNTNPQDTLDVKGLARITGQLGSPNYLRIDNTANAGGRVWRVGDTGALSIGNFSVYDQTDAKSPLVIMGTGNVGIGGNTAPAGALVVKGAANVDASIFASGGNMFIEGENDAGNAFGPMIVSGSTVSFAINGLTKVFVDASGNLILQANSGGSFIFQDGTSQNTAAVSAYNAGTLQTSNGADFTITSMGPCIAGSTVTFTSISNSTATFIFSGAMLNAGGLGQDVSCAFLLDGSFVSGSGLPLTGNTKNSIGAGNSGNMSFSYPQSFASAAVHNICVTCAENGGGSAIRPLAPYTTQVR